MSAVSASNAQRRSVERLSLFGRVVLKMPLQISRPAPCPVVISQSAFPGVQISLFPFSSRCAGVWERAIDFEDPQDGAWKTLLPPLLKARAVKGSSAPCDSDG